MNLNHITIFVSDINRSIDFYQTLGLQLIVKDKHYARFLCPYGNSTFSIHLTKNQIYPATVTIYFECEDLDSIVNFLKNEGLHFDQDPVNQTWLWREAYLKDPDGYRICLYYAGKNRIHPPWRIHE